jgi:hypothetical protein
VAVVNGSVRQWQSCEAADGSKGMEGMGVSVGRKTGFFHFARRFWTNSPDCWNSVEDEEVVDLGRLGEIDMRRSVSAAGIVRLVPAREGAMRRVVLPVRVLI